MVYHRPHALPMILRPLYIMPTPAVSGLMPVSRSVARWAKSFGWVKTPLNLKLELTDKQRWYLRDLFAWEKQSVKSTKEIL